MIMGIRAGPPGEENKWKEVCHEGEKEMMKAGEAVRDTNSHRRGSFSTIGTGFSQGGGQTHPQNFANSKVKAKVLERLNGLECFKRIAGFQSCE
jgi:hypothetical protein